MRRPAAAFVLIAALLSIPFGNTVFAGQYDDAKAALERGDFATAFRIFKALADQGDATGQNGLAVMYRKGDGVSQNYAEAMRSYRRAAEQGLDKAQYGLAFMYHEGEDVAREYAEAMKWALKEAEQGFPKALFALGLRFSAAYNPKILPSSPFSSSTAASSSPASSQTPSHAEHRSTFRLL